MRYQFLSLIGVIAVSVHTHAYVSGVNQVLPLKNGRPAVALVNRDAIYLDELVRERGPAADRVALGQGRGTAEDVALLERLITVKLIVQEAATMGLDELPEISKQVAVTSREILREVLIERLVRNIAPDPAAVEKLFRESVREWKTTSLLFQDEGAARRAQKEMASGAAFSTVAARAVAAKTAQLDGEGEYHPKKDYFPQIGQELAKLRVGQVSPVIRLQAGFTVVKVVDIRYPENAEARAAAKQQDLSQRQVAFLEAHEKDLRRQYVVVNNALLKSLNYEAAQPTVDALLKDKRVIAEIKGAPSVTVGDLTDYLRMQFFHGSNQASQSRRMNEKKLDALDATLGRRLLNLEAQRLGIDKTTAYRDRVTGYKESLVFDNFVKKVVAPEQQLREDEVKQYYASHLKDYSTPGMLRLRSLAFAKRTGAEDAIRKLREGADWAWLSANAEGQMAKGAPGVLAFGGQPVMIDSMPDGLQKSLAGAKSGESRLYASPEGHFYVLAVQQVVGSTPSPYAEVRDEISKKVYAEKVAKAIETYSGKLRVQSKVETYLTKVK